MATIAGARTYAYVPGNAKNVQCMHITNQHLPERIRHAPDNLNQSATVGTISRERLAESGGHTQLPR